MSIDFTEEDLASIPQQAENTMPEDPTGTYPLPEYFFETSTNNQAIGNVRNILKFGGLSLYSGACPLCISLQSGVSFDYWSYN